MSKINKNKIVREWIRNNGACKFDFRNKDIIFPDGGIWSIRKITEKRHKVIGFKPCSWGDNKGSQVIFSKKKYDAEDYEGVLWIGELDETIEYLKSMSTMLRKIGYKTDNTIQQYNDKIMSKM